MSAGVPMILGGDKIGRTQKGNNNAYCRQRGVVGRLGQRRRGAAAFTETAGCHRQGTPALRRDSPTKTGDGTPRCSSTALTATDEAERLRNVCPFPGYRPGGAAITNAIGLAPTDRFLLLLDAHRQTFDFTLPPGSKAWDLSSRPSPR